MRVVVVMPQGPREAYAAIEEAGHELVLGDSESSRGQRPSDDSIIPLAQGAHCLIYNEGSRRLMEALPELRACVATGLRARAPPGDDAGKEGAVPVRIEVAQVRGLRLERKVGPVDHLA